MDVCIAEPSCSLRQVRGRACVGRTGEVITLTAPKCLFVFSESISNVFDAAAVALSGGEDGLGMLAAEVGDGNGSDIRWQ